MNCCIYVLRKKEKQVFLAKEKQVVCQLNKIKIIETINAYEAPS